MVGSLVCHPIITVLWGLLGLSLNNTIILLTMMKANETQGQGYLTREDFNPMGKHTQIVFVLEQFK